MSGQCPYKSPPHRHWWLEGYWCCYGYGVRHAPGHIAKAYQTVWLLGWDAMAKRRKYVQAHPHPHHTRGLHASTPVTAGDRQT